MDTNRVRWCTWVVVIFCSRFSWCEGWVGELMQMFLSRRGLLTATMQNTRTIIWHENRCVVLSIRLECQIVVLCDACWKVYWSFLNSLGQRWMRYTAKKINAASYLQALPANTSVLERDMLKFYGTEEVRMKNWIGDLLQTLAGSFNVINKSFDKEVPQLWTSLLLIYMTFCDDYLFQWSSILSHNYFGHTILSSAGFSTCRQENWPELKYK